MSNDSIGPVLVIFGWKETEEERKVKREVGRTITKKGCPRSGEHKSLVHSLVESHYCSFCGATLVDMDEKIMGRMTRLIGFEGGVDSIASWGAAAIETAEGVRNTVSGRTTTLRDFEVLAESRAVTKLAPADVPDEVQHLPAVLLRVRTAAKVPDQKLISRASFHSWEVGGDRYWLFESAEELQRTVARVVDQLTRAALNGGAFGPFLELASALVPTHPEMNALWAHDKGTLLAERMAASTVGAAGRERFDQMLKALKQRGHGRENSGSR